MQVGGYSSRFMLLAILIVGTVLMFLVTALSVAHSLSGDQLLAPALGWQSWGSLPEAIRLPVLMTILSSFVIIGCFFWVRFSGLRSEDRAHDLLYYLGFIGTLCGLLGASVGLSLGLEGATQNPVPMMVAQNGVALSTTLLGMVFRNGLSYWYRPAQPDIEAMLASVSDAAKRTSASVGALTGNVEAFTSAVSGFGSSLDETSRNIADDAPNWAALGTSVQSATTTLKDTSQSMGEVATSVRRVGSESYTMAQSVGRAMQNLNRQIEEISAQLEELRGAVAPILDEQLVSSVRQRASRPPPTPPGRQVSSETSSMVAAVATAPGRGSRHQTGTIEGTRDGEWA